MDIFKKDKKKQKKGQYEEKIKQEVLKHKKSPNYHAQENRTQVI